MFKKLFSKANNNNRENAITKTLDVENFSALKIRGPYVVVYKKGQKASVTAEMHEKHIEYLQVSVKGNVLYVDYTKQFVSMSGFGDFPKLYITSPNLEEASFEGAVKTTDWDTINADNFSLHAEGAVSISMHLVVVNLTIKAEGAAKFDLSGNASDVDITLEGAVKVNAKDLLTKRSKIHLEGAGSAKIACSEHLDVHLEGIGFVKYYGSPAVNKVIEGLGRVSRG